MSEDSKTANLSPAKRALLERLRKRAPLAPAPLIRPRASRHRAPLSFAQQRMWLIQQLDPESYLYNEPRALRIHGQLGAGVLERALNSVIARHEVLRTTFREDRNGELWQEISPELEIPLPATDLSSHPEPEREEELKRRMLEFGRQPFDLTRLPLLRAHLYQLGAHDHVLAMSFHHIISDGWTGGIFFRELGEFYQAELSGARPQLRELPVQYADYALWQREWMQGPVLENELKFWQKHLEGAPPSIDLPSDRARPEALDYAGEFASIPLSRALSDRLKELGRDEATTLFPVFLAGLNLLVARWSGQQDLVVGTISANRDHMEIENLIGCCTNFLPLRSQVVPEQTALDLLRRTKKVVLEGFEHQNCPFEKITEAVRPQRALNVNPLYNISLQVQNYPEMAFRTAELEARLIRFDLGVAFLDLRFLAEERDGVLWLDCEYNRHLFDAKTIEALLRGYVSVLEQIALRPQMRVREITLPHSLLEQARAARKRLARETLLITASFTAEPLSEPLSFWMKELGISAEVSFAPYGQLFQQLLDPASLVAGNTEGANIFLVRFSDWLRGLKSDSEEEARREITRNVNELARAIESAAGRSPLPLILAVCPSPGSMGAAPEWAEFLARMENSLLARLAAVDHVYAISPADILRRYPVENYHDEYSDKLGHIPYTAPYFTALASTLARCWFSLRSSRRTVIVIDGDDTLWTENPAEQTWVDASRRILGEFLVRQVESGMLLAVTTSSPQAADRVFLENSGTVLGDEHIVARRVKSDSPTRDLEDLARELGTGLEQFVFFARQAQSCAEVRSRSPEVLCLELPQDSRQFAGYLEAVWAFDRWKPAGEQALSVADVAGQNQLLTRIARELRDLGQISRALEAKRVVGREVRAAWVAPRTPIEEMVAGTWSELLKLERIGVHDDFFALGGHSLLATQVMARVRQTLNVELPLRTLFEAPRLAEFAGRIEEARTSREQLRAPAIPKLAGRDRLPLSFAQQRLWFLDQLEPGNPIYNIPQMFRLRGVLDAPRLERSLNAIVARHESLRTSFQAENGEPIEVVAPRLELPLPLSDLRGLEGPERDAEVERLAAEEAAEPFDLSRGPLLRARLLRLSAQDHVLLLTMHHIVSDRWSLGLLSEELAAHYRAFTADEPCPLPELQIQYPDFAAWQRSWLQGEILEKQLTYWKRQLESAPGVLELPADRSRPAVMSHRGRTQTILLERDLLDRLNRLSQTEGVTLYMTLLAAFQTLLGRYTGQEDIVVGSPIANRNFAEVEPLIGFFINTLALRGDLSGDPSFQELLVRVRETCLEAYAHQDIPFEKLVEELEPERSLAHSPIFQVMLAVQNAPMRPLELPALEVERVPLYTATSMFDMSWFAIEVPQGLTIRAEYATDLFDDDRIARALGHFKTLLESITANPAQRLSQFSILGQEERDQLLVAFNENGADLPGPSSLPKLIERAVARFPERTAVVCGGERLSYRELNERSNRIAQHLVGLGAGPDVLIAIFLERTSRLLPAIIGVLKAGAAYVPLDPNYPRERIAAIVQDARAPIVLTQQSLAPQVAGAVAKIICLDSDWDRIEREPGENLQREPQPENLAYVLFTSGSTGRPKGVALEHRSAATFVKWAQTVFTDEELSGVLLSTSVCFDLSIFEIFVPLSAGGKVIVVENALYLPAAEARDEVSLINTVPSAIAELIHSRSVPPSVKTINLAGEALSPSLVGEIYASSNAAKVYNLYGPTEDTTYSTYTLTLAGRPVTIGRPLPGTQAYVLDSHSNLQPIGVPGELYLAGAGLARGYYGRPDLTAERFLPNPFGPDNSRMYKTGDLCRWRPEGTLEYLGRLDHQVKLRGFRIELGEIESVLTRHAGVRQSLVMAREDEPGMKRLVAYVVPSAGERPGEQELREHLNESLPEFMIPSAFVFLDAFPLTPNGKVNRQALPAPELKHSTEDFVAPRTPIEEMVAAIWAKVLHIDRISVNDDFFMLGGHSLLATQVVSRLRQSFNADISLRAIFETPTVRELAERVEALRTPGEKHGQAIPRLPRNAALPLSFAQQRLWFLNQLEPNNPLYNVPIAIGITGQLDFAALVRALNEIVRRHEVLRTTFELRDNQPRQVIAPELALDVPISDLSGVAPEAQQAEVRRLAIEGAKEIFNLERGPLFRASLLRLAGEEHVLLLNMHHIVSDGWSLWQFIRELGPLYGAFIEGRPSPLPELPIQYADYAVWQRQSMAGEALERHLAYWTKQLEGAPRVLELPADRMRPAVESYRGATLTRKFPLELLERLRALSRDEGATLFMTLLAAYQILLERYTGQEDVVVGSPIANRTRAEIEELIGFFVNAIVLRTDLSGNPSFRKLLSRV
ncbi:MAG: amino acid adenylation domain-containing protein, partial [Acidobacteria bacterium]|nr:amino acid adenylation domain-containing protein [Acidobacteriota bacterium]